MWGVWKGFSLKVGQGNWQPWVCWVTQKLKCSPGWRPSLHALHRKCRDFPSGRSCLPDPVYKLRAAALLSHLAVHSHFTNRCLQNSNATPPPAFTRTGATSKRGQRPHPSLTPRFPLKRGF